MQRTKEKRGFSVRAAWPPPPAFPLGEESQGPRDLELTAGSFPDHPKPPWRAPSLCPSWGGTCEEGRRAGSPTPLRSRGELSGAQDSNLESHVQVPVKKDLSESRTGPVLFKSLLAFVTLKYMRMWDMGPCLLPCPRAHNCVGQSTKWTLFCILDFRAVYFM